MIVPQRIVAATIVLFLGIVAPAFAATIHVPADQPTIQNGVNAADPGDTVLVAPGSYRELIRMKNGVVLKSAQGPDSTVLVTPRIAESQLDERVIECLEGIDRSTIIEGFRFDADGFPGCGIFCEKGSPTIRGNDIRDFGWGINLRHSAALIAENVIEGCYTFAILCFASEPEIHRNIIRKNLTIAISVSGKKSRPIIGGSTENGNQIFGNQVAIVNDSVNDLDATGNDWGFEVAVEMEDKGWPADISVIVDGNDESFTHKGRGIVDYQNWKRLAGAESTSGYPPYALPVAGAVVLIVIFVAVSRRRAA